MRRTIYGSYIDGSDSVIIETLMSERDYAVRSRDRWCTAALVLAIALMLTIIAFLAAHRSDWLSRPPQEVSLHGQPRHVPESTLSPLLGQFLKYE